MRVELVAAALFVSTFIPSAVNACSEATVSPDDIVENQKDYSPNREYVVVTRTYRTLGDFASGRRGDVAQDDSQIELPSDVWEAFADDESKSPLLEEAHESTTVDFVLYHRGKNGFERIASFNADPAHQLLVSNDGAFIVAPPPRICGTSPGAQEVTRVFTPSGLQLSFRLGDVLTENDLTRVNSLTLGFTLDFAIDATRSDVLEIAFRNENRSPRIARVSLFDGQRLDGKTDLFPPPYRQTLEITIAGRSLPVTSRDLSAGYPSVAVRAHIQGAVIVDFEVAADGRVISTSVVKPLPFGLTVAAEKTIREWVAPPEILKSHAAPLKGTAKFTFTLFPDDDGPGAEVPSRAFTTSDKGS